MRHVCDSQDALVLSGKSLLRPRLSPGARQGLSAVEVSIGARPPGLIPSLGDWALTIVAMPLLPWYLAVRS